MCFSWVFLNNLLLKKRQIMVEFYSVVNLMKPKWSICIHYKNDIWIHFKINYIIIKFVATMSPHRAV